MTSDDRNCVGGLSLKRLVLSCALLSAAILLAVPLVGWWGQSRHGTDGWRAAFVAAGVCWLGSILALFVAGFARGPNRALLVVLAGMVFRMGLPLVVGTALTNSGDSLVTAGMFEMILIFYFVTLVVETPMTLHLIRQAPQSGKVS